MLDTPLPMSDYTHLDAAEVVKTTEILAQRVFERFPDSGLYRVGLRLLEISKEVKERSEFISRPNLYLRGGITLLIGLIIVGLIGAVCVFEFPQGKMGFFDFIQLVESGINDVVFVGIIVVFLVTVESRLKRGRALTAIHDLRSLAHIVDMHQLTKDPERVLSVGKSTNASPKTAMTPFELGRYLDYCSEMLAVMGKISALYVQKFRDPIVLNAVTEMENLTSGLSRKIWQKLIILRSSSDFK
jgi:hypothetical protein